MSSYSTRRLRLERASAVLCGLFAALGVVQGAGASELSRLDELVRSEQAFRKGLAAEHRGALGNARSHYTRAIELDASFVEALVNLAGVDRRLGSTEEAHERATRATALQPSYPRAWEALGLVALASADRLAAIAALERAHALDDHDIAIATNLASALIENGEAARARAVLSPIVAADPIATDAVYNLALANDLLGDVPRARFGYERFLKLAAPDDPARMRVAARAADLDAFERGVRTPRQEEADSPAIGSAVAKIPYTGPEGSNP